MQQGFEEALAGCIGIGEAGLQSVAQRHQFIDRGDDAVLLGEGWEGEGNTGNDFALDFLECGAGRIGVDLARKCLHRQGDDFNRNTP